MRCPVLPRRLPHCFPSCRLLPLVHFPSSSPLRVPRTSVVALCALFFPPPSFLGTWASVCLTLPACRRPVLWISAGKLHIDHRPIVWHPPTQPFRITHEAHRSTRTSLRGFALLARDTHTQVDRARVPIRRGQRKYTSYIGSCRCQHQLPPQPFSRADSIAASSMPRLLGARSLR